MLKKTIAASLAFLLLVNGVIPASVNATRSPLTSTGVLWTSDAFAQALSFFHRGFNRRASIVSRRWISPQVLLSVAWTFRGTPLSRFLHHHVFPHEEEKDTYHAFADIYLTVEALLESFQSGSLEASELFCIEPISRWIYFGGYVLAQTHRRKALVKNTSGQIELRRLTDEEVLAIFGLGKQRRQVFLRIYMDRRLHGQSVAQASREAYKAAVQTHAEHNRRVSRSGGVYANEFSDLEFYSHMHRSGKIESYLSRVIRTPQHRLDLQQTLGQTLAFIRQRLPNVDDVSRTFLEKAIAHLETLNLYEFNAKRNPEGDFCVGLISRERFYLSTIWLTHRSLTVEDRAYTLMTFIKEGYEIYFKSREGFNHPQDVDLELVLTQIYGSTEIKEAIKKETDHVLDLDQLFEPEVADADSTIARFNAFSPGQPLSSSLKLVDLWLSEGDRDTGSVLQSAAELAKAKMRMLVGDSVPEEQLLGSWIKRAEEILADPDAKSREEQFAPLRPVLFHIILPLLGASLFRAQFNDQGLPNYRMFWDTYRYMESIFSELSFLIDMVVRHPFSQVEVLRFPSDWVQRAEEYVKLQRILAELYFKHAGNAYNFLEHKAVTSPALTKNGVKIYSNDGLQTIDIEKVYPPPFVPIRLERIPLEVSRERLVNVPYLGTLSLGDLHQFVHMLGGETYENQVVIGTTKDDLFSFGMTNYANPRTPQSERIFHANQITSGSMTIPRYTTLLSEGPTSRALSVFFFTKSVVGIILRVLAERSPKGINLISWTDDEEETLSKKTFIQLPSEDSRWIQIMTTLVRVWTATTPRRLKATFYTPEGLDVPDLARTIEMSQRIYQSHFITVLRAYLKYKHLKLRELSPQTLRDLYFYFLFGRINTELEQNFKNMETPLLVQFIANLMNASPRPDMADGSAFIMRFFQATQHFSIDGVRYDAVELEKWEKRFLDPEFGPAHFEAWRAEHQNEFNAPMPGPPMLTPETVYRVVDNPDYEDLSPEIIAEDHFLRVDDKRLPSFGNLPAKHVLVTIYSDEGARVPGSPFRYFNESFSKGAPVSVVVRGHEIEIESGSHSERMATTLLKPGQTDPDFLRRFKFHPEHVTDVPSHTGSFSRNLPNGFYRVSRSTDGLVRLPGPNGDSAWDSSGISAGPLIIWVSDGMQTLYHANGALVTQPLHELLPLRHLTNYATLEEYHVGLAREAIIEQFDRKTIGYRYLLDPKAAEVSIEKDIVHIPTTIAVSDLVAALELIGKKDSIFVLKTYRDKLAGWLPTANRAATNDAFDEKQSLNERRGMPQQPPATWRREAQQVYRELWKEINVQEGRLRALRTLGQNLGQNQRLKLPGLLSVLLSTFERKRLPTPYVIPIVKGTPLPAIGIITTQSLIEKAGHYFVTRSALENPREFDAPTYLCVVYEDKTNPSGHLKVDLFDPEAQRAVNPKEMSGITRAQLLQRVNFALVEPITDEFLNNLLDEFTGAQEKELRACLEQLFPADAAPKFFMPGEENADINRGLVNFILASLQNRGSNGGAEKAVLQLKNWTDNISKRPASLWNVLSHLLKEWQIDSDAKADMRDALTHVLPLLLREAEGRQYELDLDDLKEVDRMATAMNQDISQAIFFYQAGLVKKEADNGWVWEHEHTARDYGSNSDLLNRPYLQALFNFLKRTQRVEYAKSEPPQSKVAYPPAAPNALDPFRIVNYGGHNKIGNSCRLVTVAGARILVDVGLSLRKNAIFGPNFHLMAGEPLPDGVLLTHAHEDHVGGAAWAHLQFNKQVPFYATAETARLLPLVLKGLIHRREEMSYNGISTSHLPFFSEGDIDSFMKNVYILPTNTDIAWNEHVTLRLLPNGHMPGSVSPLIMTPVGDMYMTSDVLSKPHGKLWPFTPVPKHIRVHYVEAESTNFPDVTVNHPTEDLLDYVELALLEEEGEKKGSAVVATTASRAPMILDLLLNNDREFLAQVPIYIDGKAEDYIRAVHVSQHIQDRVHFISELKNAEHSTREEVRAWVAQHVPQAIFLTTGGEFQGSTSLISNQLSAAEKPFTVIEVASFDDDMVEEESQKTTVHFNGHATTDQLGDMLLELVSQGLREVSLVHPGRLSVRDKLRAKLDTVSVNVYGKRAGLRLAAVDNSADEEERQRLDGKPKRLEDIRQPARPLAAKFISSVGGVIALALLVSATLSHLGIGHHAVIQYVWAILFPAPLLNRSFDLSRRRRQAAA